MLILISRKLDVLKGTADEISSKTGNKVIFCRIVNVLCIILYIFLDFFFAFACFYGLVKFLSDIVFKSYNCLSITI